MKEWLVAALLLGVVLGAGAALKAGTGEREDEPRLVRPPEAVVVVSRREISGFRAEGGVPPAGRL